MTGNMGCSPRWRDRAPREIYASQTWFDLEVERVLRRDWWPVARSSDFKTPGAYRTLDLFGEPVLIARGGDGRLRAFANVCRHRFANIAAGEGVTRRFVCPYHAWTYGLDGGLVGAPCMDGAHGFERANLALHAYALEEWRGWVFVALEGRPPSIAERTQPLGAKLNSLSVEHWVTARLPSYPAPWNWKLMVENFNESYHHLAVHKETLNPFWPASETSGVATNGEYSELRHPDHPDAGTFTVYTVFPGLAFALQSPAPVIYWPRMTIRGARDMTLDMELIAPRPCGTIGPDGSARRCNRCDQQRGLPTAARRSARRRKSRRQAGPALHARTTSPTLSHLFGARDGRWLIPARSLAATPLCRRKVGAPAHV